MKLRKWFVSNSSTCSFCGSYDWECDCSEKPIPMGRRVRITLYDNELLGGCVGEVVGIGMYAVEVRLLIILLDSPITHNGEEHRAVLVPENNLEAE